MPTLKTHRGTVLYATLVFSPPVNDINVLVAAVLNDGIGAIQRNRFLLDDDTPVAMETIYPELIGATIQSVRLSIAYPDGTVALVPEIGLGDLVLIGWSETQLLSVEPVVDPDWHQNKSYLRVIATL